MQDFATGKAALGMALRHQLTRFFEKNCKAVRVMKITGILLMAACLQVSANGITQTVTISMKDAPLIIVLKEIKKQTGYSFFADSKLLEKAKKISITANNLSISQVLDLCFKDQPLTYSIIDKVINVYAKKERASTENSNFQIPDITIKGRIVDANGQPISNATVTVKGTAKSTLTSANGEFLLAAVNENATLVITHVQYETQTISLHGNEIVNATLQIKVSSLDELQVIAYGTTTKRFATGNVSSVKSSDIEKQPVNNPLLALEGRVPGLFITQNTGVPGGGVTVRIQGQNSLLSGSEPLYVIDGVPYTQKSMPNLSGLFGILSTSGGSPLSFINPGDIESIEVLKDADATSIYGSRAAAGAILITTKKGKAGKTKIDVNAQTGWGKVTRFLPLLNTEQYLEMRKEAFNNDGRVIPNISTSPNDVNYDINGFWNQAKYTDWQKELLGGTAKYNDVQASVSGGNANTTFLIGSGYHKETTVFPGDLSDQKGSLHINLNNISTNQKFRTQFSGSYLVDNNNLISTDITSQAIKLSPNAPALYNDDGSLNWAPLPNGTSTWYNPLAYLAQKYNSKSKNLIANALIGYQLIKGLNLQSSFGYNNLHTDEYMIYPSLSFSPEDRAFNPRAALFSNSNITSWIIEPQASYNATIGKGTIDALVGATVLKENRDNQALVAFDYSSDLLLTDIKSAGAVIVENTTPSVYRYNAIFGRVNYKYQNKYIVNLTARRDGSSRFGSENLFHNFYSIAGAWIFSNESFIKSNLRLLSFGKIRFSYGTTGNDQIGNYQFLSLYSNVNVAQPYGGVAALAPNSSLPNPYLQWEETKKLQLGFDLGFFGDRLLINTNYFLNRSSNQLQQYALPFITGRNYIQRNYPATIQNYGWEIVLNTTNIQTKNFSWKSSFNLTINKNKLVDYPGLATSTYANSLVIGQPFTILKRAHYLGVDPATGLYIFEDQKGNSVSSGLTDSARTRIINTSPKFYGGFENTFQFKRFELSVLFQFTKQTSINYLFGDRPGRFSTDASGSLGSNNQPIWVMNRWQKAGDDASIQKFSTTYPSAINTAFNYITNLSDARYSDGSYIRLKNISLSWQIPQSWEQKARLQSARIYVQGQNLLTITNYKGMDPETGFSGLPPLRIVTVGVKITL